MIILFIFAILISKIRVMLFFFGHYYTRFKKHRLHDTVCPNCGSENSMDLTAGCRTWHLMFIPVAPGFKRITQRCTACKGEFYPFPDKKDAADRMEAETRRPWYLYFWLWLIGLVLAYGITMVVIANLRG